MSEDALKKALRKKPEPKQGYLPIDYEWIRQELKDPHVTMNILYEKYEEKAKASGLIPCSRTQFFDTCNVFADVVKCDAHIKRKPGDSLELDFAGDLTYYTNVHHGGFAGRSVPGFAFIQQADVRESHRVAESGFLHQRHNGSIRSDRRGHPLPDRRQNQGGRDNPQQDRPCSTELQLHELPLSDMSCC